MNLQRIYQIRLPALIYMVNLTAKRNRTGSFGNVFILNKVLSGQNG